MTELPAGLLLRRPAKEDLQATVDLLNACSIVDLGYPDSTPEDLAADWALPRFDLSRDAWLVVSPEKRLVGYGWLWDKKPHVDIHGDVYVHPDHRGRVIETVLLERIEERAREHVPAAPASESVEIGMFAPVGDSYMSPLFYDRGYERIRTFFRMRIDLAGGYPAPSWPVGIVARAYRPGVDEAAAYIVLQESFADHFRFAPEPQGEWVDRRVGYGNFDPALWLIAWDGEEPAGAILTYNFPDLGWVRELGVRRLWRGRGIGKALLLESFRLFDQRGQGRVCLGVDAANATGATKLYEQVGMRVEQAHDLHQLVIRPATVDTPRV
jgi:mycothiol synthase